MKLNFDFDNINVVEFGIGIDDINGGQEFSLIPIDDSVQRALTEMAQATWAAMQDVSSSPDRYEPSEKYGSTEYLYLPLADRLATFLRQLHEAVNLQFSNERLNDPDMIFCYFARLTDRTKNHLTALRRSTQFKGVLKSRLIRLVSDALKLIEDRVFKLDMDFDLLMDSTNLFILRPSGFEFTGGIESDILAAVTKNVDNIQKELSFVMFDNITQYAREHSRAARYLASIRSEGWAKNIDRASLRRWCKKAGIKIKESKGKIEIESGFEIGFLELLDRRLYELDLVKGPPERFKAASRKKI